MPQVFCEFDKAQAEWVVVAYLAQDARMIEVVENKEDPHAVTGHLISGVPLDLIKEESKAVGHLTDPALIARARESIPALFEKNYFLPRTFSIRQGGKKSNHALNYDETWYRFMMENEIEAQESKKIVELYHRGYPGIRGGFHEFVKKQMRKDRTLINCFDRRIRLLDAWSADFLKSAYSALPQSTVADIIIDGMNDIYEDNELCDEAEVMTQTYDSLLIQHPPKWTKLARVCIKTAFDYINPECEYFNRKFRIDSELKIGPTWGDMIEVPLTTKVKEMAERLEHGYKEALILQATRTSQST